MFEDMIGHMFYETIWVIRADNTKTKESRIVEFVKGSKMNVEKHIHLNVLPGISKDEVISVCETIQPKTNDSEGV